MRYHHIVMLVLGLCLGASDTAAAKLAPAARESKLTNIGALCAIAAVQAERRHRLRRGWLAAISLKETGRWNDESGVSYPWPWTVTALGQGRYLPSKRAAIEMVRELRARGIENIDVGCFQINLRYHPDAFTDLDQAFDPKANADYAAKFLDRLRRAHGGWIQAVSRYHSADPQRGRRYWLAVSKLRLKPIKMRSALARDRDQKESRQREALRAKVRRARVERQRNINELRRLKAEQRRQRRAEFELRTAKVFAAWTEVVRGRSNHGNPESGI